jgi:hypothetical protein
MSMIDLPGDLCVNDISAAHKSLSLLVKGFQISFRAVNCSVMGEKSTS